MDDFSDFGSNPGNLKGWSYIPSHAGAGDALVVVLHGCTQSAGSYNHGAGWIAAADEHGFALLFPEQQRANNLNLCFNWFSADDAERGEGEALSIVQMVLAMCERHSLDKNRVFVTGLSAGGAMTAAMLATYPELFAGGAVIAGLPFGTATSIPAALERMRGQAGFGAGELAGFVRSASRHSGPWPQLSVWHGSGDQTVDDSNAAALVEQWRGLHGLGEAPTRTEMVAGHRRRIWCSPDGREVIDDYRIENMGHGTPIDARNADDEENKGPFMLDVGISSTRRIIGFWGLDRAGKRPHVAPSRSAPLPARAAPLIDPEGRPSSSQPTGGSSKVQAVIESALRKAGLMR